MYRGFRDEMLKRAGKEESIRVKEDDSDVTELDEKIERELRSKLEQRFPDLSVFGEEGSYDVAELRKLSAFWLLDPIDGTKAFMKGEPTFTCMAMCIERSEETSQLEVTRALIYNPSEDVMYVGQRGQGVRRIAFNDDGEPTETRIDLGNQPLPESPVALCKDKLIPQVEPLLASVGVVCRPAPSGGGFRYTRVLEGEAQAGFQLHGGGKIHDYAIGFLVTEAGGVVVPILDDENTWENGVSSVACHPGLEEVVRAHIPELRAIEHQKS